MTNLVNKQSELRPTALQLAIQCGKADDTPAAIVARAEVFLAFLMKPDPLKS